MREGNESLEAVNLRLRKAYEEEREFSKKTLKRLRDAFVGIDMGHAQFKEAREEADKAIAIIRSLLRRISRTCGEPPCNICAPCEAHSWLRRDRVAPTPVIGYAELIEARDAAVNELQKAKRRLELAPDADIVKEVTARINRDNDSWRIVHLLQFTRAEKACEILKEARPLLEYLASAVSDEDLEGWPARARACLNKYKEYEDL